MSTSSRTPSQLSTRAPTGLPGTSRSERGRSRSLRVRAESGSAATAARSRGSTRLRGRWWGGRSTSVPTATTSRSASARCGSQVETTTGSCGSTPEVEGVIQGDGVAGSAEPVLWVATGAGSVWATQGRRLLRISPKGRRLQTIPIPPAAGLAAGPALAWIVTAPDRNQLLAFGAAGRKRFEKKLGDNAVSPVASGAAVWLVVYAGLGEVQRRSLSAPTQINGHPGLGRYPLAVALGDGSAWVVNTEGTVWRLDEALTSVDKRIDTAPTARSPLAVGYANVWSAIQHPSKEVSLPCFDGGWLWPAVVTPRKARQQIKEGVRGGTLGPPALTAVLVPDLALGELFQG